MIHRLLARDPDSIPQGADGVERTLFLRKVTEEALRVTRYFVLWVSTPWRISCFGLHTVESGSTGSRCLGNRRCCLSFCREIQRVSSFFCHPQASAAPRACPSACSCPLVDVSYEHEIQCRREFPSFRKALAREGWDMSRIILGGGPWVSRWGSLSKEG